MIPRILKTLVFILILGTVFYSKDIFADLEIGVLDTDISVSTIPESPEPYQNISIQLSSYSTDLSLATIQWKNGSSVVLSGYGKTRYSFTAPGPNSSTTLDVTIVPSGSTNRVNKKITISPAAMDLLWESVDGYTPPFYKGKSFVSGEGKIKVVALPTTNAIKSGRGTISYTWKNNGNAVQNASGYNKDSYIFTNSELNSKEKVSVQALSTDGSYSATKAVEIPIIDPQILFYKKSPTDGILYNSDLGTQATMTEDEMTVVAAPYFLALTGNEDAFTYTWKINGEEIDTPSKKTELTVRPSSRGGYATIDAVFENLNTFYQKVSGQLKLNL